MNPLYAIESATGIWFDDVVPGLLCLIFLFGGFISMKRVNELFFLYGEKESVIWVTEEEIIC